MRKWEILMKMSEFLTFSWYHGKTLVWNTNAVILYQYCIPELKIGFAFCPTFLNSEDMLNQRGAELQEIVKQCAAALVESN